MPRYIGMNKRAPDNRKSRKGAVKGDGKVDSGAVLARVAQRKPNLTDFDTIRAKSRHRQPTSRSVNRHKRKR